MVRGAGQKARAKAAAAVTSGHVGSIPSGDHLKLIQQALKLAGVEDNAVNERAVNQIVSFESGWNPNAINLTDINAQEGHPSQGLMQTIPGTFSRWRLPSLSSNINDPLSNLVAGIRYAVANYGALSSVPGVAAVNQGGRYVGYDSGGWLNPGSALTVNKTGIPEAVLTGEQWADVSRLLAGQEMTIGLAKQAVLNNRPAVKPNEVNRAGYGRQTVIEEVNVINPRQERSSESLPTVLRRTARVAP
jgi:SLT domain-containing protein